MKTGSETVLNWIKEFKEAHGKPPTIEEVEAQLSMAIDYDKDLIGDLKMEIKNSLEIAEDYRQRLCNAVNRSG
jgi:hypothetical protein